MDVQALTEEIVGTANDDAYTVLAGTLVDRMAGLGRIEQAEMLKVALRGILGMAVRGVLLAASREVETLQREVARLRSEHAGYPEGG